MQKKIMALFAVSVFTSVLQVQAIPEHVKRQQAEQKKAEHKESPRVQYFYWNSSLSTYISDELDRLFGGGRQVNEKGQNVYIIYNLYGLRKQIQELCLRHRGEISNFWGYVSSETVDGIIAKVALDHVRKRAKILAEKHPKVGQRFVTVYEDGKLQTSKESDILADAVQHEALMSLQAALQAGNGQTLPDGILSDFRGAPLEQKVETFHARINVFLAQQAEMLRRQQQAAQQPAT